MLWSNGRRPFRSAHQRIENFFQQPAAAQYAGFHGADGNFKHFSHLFVGQAFQIS